MVQKMSLLWLIGLIGLSSCLTFEKYPIEVYKPSNYTFPSYVRTVGVASRNLKYASDTLTNYYLNNGRLTKDQRSLDYEMLARQICLDSVAAKLDGLQKFDSVFVLPAETFPEKRLSEIYPASNEWAQPLAQKTGADALIFLDMFSCFYRVSDRFDNPHANVITSNIWTVYDAHQQKIVDRYRQIDTLYWNSVDEEGNFRRIKLPVKTEAIRLAAGVIAKNYTKQIVSDWNVVYRTILNGNNREQIEASRLAKKGEWADAKAIWERLLESQKRRPRAIALYNLALESEMDGNTEKAIEYCKKAADESKGIFFANINEATRDYSAVLFKRKIDLEKLKSQNENQ